jgi:uncharacterized protein (TIGR01777 family)
MRICVSGGSGFIGRHLCSALRARGDEVLETSLRDPHSAAAAAAGCDAFVNLSGESIAQRWTPASKREILESRTLLPLRFFEALAALDRRPAVYVSASAVGYYGTGESASFTEASPPGDDFLAGVCSKWEATAQRGADFGMRVACVRAGLVLGKDGGALAKLLPLFKAGTGGRVGTGRQWYSWIHIADAIGIYLLALDAVSGAINATAPNPVTNAQFTETLAAVLHRPAALPAPAFMLKMMLGEGAMIVLEGQRVLPQRAMDQGYEFRFPDLRAALTDLLG